jgi:hypothetical protein
VFFLSHHLERLANLESFLLQVLPIVYSAIHLMKVSDREILRDLLRNKPSLLSLLQLVDKRADDVIAFFQ